MDQQLTLLKGKIVAYESHLLKADFFIQHDRHQQSAAESASAAMVAGAVALGLGAAAMATALNSSSRTEEADRVSFQLNGESIEGWLWRSPFREGDHVEVVAAKCATHWEALAVARPKDRIIALYPHLSRGRRAHAISAAVIWLKLMSLMTCIFFAIALLIILFEDDSFRRAANFVHFFTFVGIPSIWLFFLMPGIHITWRWMRFVRVAEDVFRTFGWQDVERIDLCKSSRNSKGPDVFGYGALYYKY